MMVSDVVGLAGDVREAIALLRAADLGQDPWGAVDKSRLRPPDAMALRLLDLVPDDDESTAVELFIAAGYDYTYASALMARTPRFAPDPELVRRLLAEARLVEKSEGDL
ncbi:hypothetical protein ACQEVF_57380 [Nonomuraea polychroma]|uniref:hypothetical protein n=1 Tax=Nonomuraea polychroma TaxID=46176 RepID=UPI003D9312F6